MNPRLRAEIIDCLELLGTVVFLGLIAVVIVGVARGFLLP